MTEENRELIPIEDLTRLDVQPGDVLLLQSKVTLSRETAERLEAEFSRRLPGVEILVCDDEIEAKAILRPPAADRSGR